MRVIRILSLGLFLASPLHAFSDEECREMGRLAENVMKLRQIDANLSLVLSSVVDPKQPEVVQKLVREIILGAYDQPSYSTPKMQEKATAEYKNDIELECYKNGF